MAARKTTRKKRAPVVEAPVDTGIRVSQGPALNPEQARVLRETEASNAIDRANRIGGGKITISQDFRGKVDTLEFPIRTVPDGYAYAFQDAKEALRKWHDEANTAVREVY